MADIVLSTLNASYGHASLALRYLRANLGELRDRAVIREFVTGSVTTDLVEELLADDPRIVAFGVYVWNATETLALVKALKAVRPEIDVVLGGPEVSYEHERQEIVARADFVIVGEGELAFAELAAQLLAGKRPLAKVRPAALPDPKKLVSPYSLYTDEDLANRAIYVEASRGCPFTCEFCLSALPIKVRQFEIEPFLADLKTLYERGARQFRFIDRTFNLSYAISSRILEFFVDKPDVFAHFEMVPDRFPERLRDLVVQFPAGALQFEIGVQTFDADVAARIGRRQDNQAVEDNIRFLRQHTGVHIHADLIGGLPGEDLQTFGRGFNRLWAARPHEIQLGILKRLNGAPIARHDQEWGMVYSDAPPYEILQTSAISFHDMQRLKRAARLWDLIGNRGNFNHALVVFDRDRDGDAFATLMAFADWLHGKIGPFVGIALPRLCQFFLDYFCAERGMDLDELGERVARSYAAAGRRLPGFLLQYEGAVSRPDKPKNVPRRQARHLAAGSQ